MPAPVFLPSPPRKEWAGTGTHCSELSEPAPAPAPTGLNTAAGASHLAVPPLMLSLNTRAVSAVSSQTTKAQQPETTPTPLPFLCSGKRTPR